VVSSGVGMEGLKMIYVYLGMLVSGVVLILFGCLKIALASYGTKRPEDENDDQ